MLTNLEGQLKQQSAAHRLDEVLAEIPRVREDLGFIPLVTPTSQIVGTQAVLNVLGGERYKTIAKETAGILKGEYGRTPGPGERRPAGAGARRRRPGDLPPGGFTQAGAGRAGSRRQTPGAGEGHHACRKRHRRRAHRGAVPAARPEVPRKPPQPGGL